MTDLSDLAVNERFAMMKRRQRTRWVIAGVVAALVLGVVVVPVALRAGHLLIKKQRVRHYDALIEKHAGEAGLSVALVKSVVLAESGGDARALSPRRAMGLMQVTAITQRDVHERNPSLDEGDLYDPDYNLRVGTTYLAHMLERFDGDVKLALAAYHMGPTAVRRLQNAHPDLSTDELIARHAGPQTRAYVRIVMEGME